MNGAFKVDLVIILKTISVENFYYLIHKKFPSQLKYNTDFDNYFIAGFTINQAGVADSIIFNNYYLCLA